MSNKLDLTEKEKVSAGYLVERLRESMRKKKVAERQQKFEQAVEDLKVLYLEANRFKTWYDLQYRLFRIIKKLDPTFKGERK